MASGRMSQRKGAAGERELTDHLRRAGYPVSWGGSRTYGTVPDVFGLPGIHIECKRVEQLNIAKAVEQAARDAERFQDASPAVFHRKNKAPWLVTMRLTDWLSLYAAAQDHNAHARFFIHPLSDFSMKGATMNVWDTEKPVTVNTGKNIIEYFREGRKLSVCKPNWIDKDGNEKRGKTVILDLDAVASTSAAIKLLETVLTAVKER